MITETPQQQYPVYFPTDNWEKLNAQADELLGFPNEGAQTYSLPIIDKYGKHWFLVQPEVRELVDLSVCVEYDKIEFEVKEIR